MREWQHVEEEEEWDIGALYPECAFDRLLDDDEED